MQNVYDFDRAGKTRIVRSTGRPHSKRALLLYDSRPNYEYSCHLLAAHWRLKCLWIGRWVRRPKPGHASATTTGRSL